jgi:hypothetical protein
VVPGYGAGPSAAGNPRGWAGHDSRMSHPPQVWVRLVPAKTSSTSAREIATWTCGVVVLGSDRSGELGNFVQDWGWPPCSAEPTDA